jgi:exopolysaccharide biosynthesis polyprenyl glycosylphosphotransferase
MLFDSHSLQQNESNRTFVERLASIVSGVIRESDLVGWYQEGVVLGVIFTEVSLEGTNSITQLLYSKVMEALRENLDHSLTSKLRVTVHLFPERWDKDHPQRVADSKLYPEVSNKKSKQSFPMMVKRAMDIAGSIALLILFSPIFVAIAVAIKLTSRGPVFFKQERVGHLGRVFQCLKFRTMYVDNDATIHRNYVQNFIAGKVQEQCKSEAGTAVYKIKDDPRVTPIGRFLRKTSLDELPQFWNVLCGEMSLVGPRPPVAYEFEVYDFWHRRRVLELRPGVTGLWQVSGRSRTSFDDMVRMDLRYSQRWSLWLDVKILLATPMAVFTGNGAY